MMETFANRTGVGMAGSVLLSFALIGCAGTRVTEKTPPETLGPDVGYVAFRYDRENDEHAVMALRRAGTEDEYRFALSKTGGAFVFAIGPVKAYEKPVGDTARRALTLMPLPAGDFEYVGIRLEVPLPAWQAFLRQESSKQEFVSLKGRTLRIAKDSVTYIGTFRSRAKARVFGVDYALSVVDDGAARADSVGVRDVLRTELLAVP